MLCYFRMSMRQERIVRTSQLKTCRLYTSLLTKEDAFNHLMSSYSQKLFAYVGKGVINDMLIAEEIVARNTFLQ